MRATIAVVLVSVLFSSASLAAGPPELKYKVVKSFSPLFDRTDPNPLRWEVNSTDGLAWDGSGIWVSGCDSMVFAKLDVNGALVDQFMLPGMEMADHLAWDGKYLWAVVHSMPNMAGPADGRMIQIDTKARKIINTVEVPFRDKKTMVPMGLGWDGKYLWSLDPANKNIYRIDPKTGAGKDKPLFKNPVINNSEISSCGISWDGHSCLWISDLNLGAYFQVDPKTGKIVSYLVPPNNPDPQKFGPFRPARVKKLFTGMTTDGDRVWVVDEVEGNPLVYELDVDFPKTGPCAHPVKAGETCTVGGQPFCKSDAVCHGSGATAICRKSCDPAAKTPGCKTGEACWRKGSAGVCLPATGGAFGETCVKNGDCQSDLCAPTKAGAICSQTCKAGGASCPTDYACEAGVAQSYCAPGAKKVDPPATGGGCSLGSSPASAFPLGAWAVFLLLFAFRRRRRLER